MDLRYKVELIRETDGSWTALIPQLFGCIGTGDTMEEALSMLEDAKSGWFASRLDDQLSIPEPQE